MISNSFLFIGSTELIAIAVITLLLFGGKKVPELMKGLGQGVRNFKKGIEEPLEGVNDNAKKSNNS